MYPRLSLIALAAALVAGNANAAIVEDFTGAQLSAPGWIGSIGTDPTPFGVPATPDGHQALYLDSSDWAYNPSISFAPGQTLSAWVEVGPGPSVDASFQGGRLYLGLGAGSSGTYSVVTASDTNQLIFQTNAGYTSFTEGASATAPLADSWYHLAVTWNTDNSVTARLFDTRNTQISSFTQTGVTATAQGIALRGIGGVAVAEIEVSAVPEPQTYALMLAGLLLVGGIARKRMA